MSVDRIVTLRFYIDSSLNRCVEFDTSLHSRESKFFYLSPAKPEWTPQEGDDEEIIRTILPICTTPADYLVDAMVCPTTLEVRYDISLDDFRRLVVNALKAAGFTVRLIVNA